MSGVIQMTQNHRILIVGVVSACLFVSTVALARKCDDDINETTAPEECKMTSTNDEHGFYRLPRHVTPQNYQLMINPNTLNMTFTGHVIIKIQISKPTKSIILHSNKLLIVAINLEGVNGTKLPQMKKPRHFRESFVKSWTLPEDNREILTVHLQKTICEGSYELDLQFVGRLDDGFVGFYASHLKNGK